MVKKIKKMVKNYLEKDKINCRFSRQCRRFTAPCCKMCLRNKNIEYRDYFMDRVTGKTSNTEIKE